MLRSLLTLLVFSSPLVIQLGSALPAQGSPGSILDVDSTGYISGHATGPIAVYVDGQASDNAVVGVSPTGSFIVGLIMPDSVLHDISIRLASTDEDLDGSPFMFRYDATPTIILPGDSEALIEALETVKPGDVIQLSSGQYDLFPSSFGYVFAGPLAVSEFSLVGRGASETRVVVHNPLGGLFHLDGHGKASGIHMARLAIDYSEPSSVQGTLVSAPSPGSQAIEVQLDANALDVQGILDSILAEEGALNKETLRSNVMNFGAGDPWVKPGSYSQNSVSSIVRDIATGNWVVTLTSGLDGMAAFQGQDRVALVWRKANVIRFRNYLAGGTICLEDIKTSELAAGNFCITDQNTGSLVIRRFEATRSAGRFITTAADFFLVLDQRGPVLMDNCVFEGGGDDIINIHSNPIQGVVDPQDPSPSVVGVLDIRTIEVGDRLQLFNFSTGALAERHVISKVLLPNLFAPGTPHAGAFVVDLALPMGMADSYLYNTELGGRGSIVSNCLLEANVGGLKARCDTLIEGNTIIRTAVAAVRITNIYAAGPSGSYVLEGGPIPFGVTVRNNIFDRCCYAGNKAGKDFIGVVEAMVWSIPSVNQGIPTYSPMANVSLESNHIMGWGRNGVVFRGADSSCFVSDLDMTDQGDPFEGNVVFPTLARGVLVENSPGVSVGFGAFSDTRAALYDCALRIDTASNPVTWSGASFVLSTGPTTDPALLICQ